MWAWLQASWAAPWTSHHWRRRGSAQRQDPRFPAPRAYHAKNHQNPWKSEIRWNARLKALPRFIDRSIWTIIIDLFSITQRSWIVEQQLIADKYICNCERGRSMLVLSSIDRLFQACRNWLLETNTEHPARIKSGRQSRISPGKARGADIIPDEVTTDKWWRCAATEDETYLCRMWDERSDTSAGQIRVASFV